MADVMASQHPQLELHSPEVESEDGLSSGPPRSSSGTSTPTNANNARRPPRKSTLTQQQKNQKRQRATQDQLMTLEVEFNKNPTPTALIRERIASDIDMTERSVQIWFQNRRAKIKNIAKRSIESGEDCDSIPDSMRQYLAMQAYGPGAKALGGGLLGRGAGFGPYGAGAFMLNPDNATGKVVIQHFACRSLSVGTWRRVGQSTMDLVIFYSPDKACITYYINNENVGYKIEYPFAWIKNITLDKGDGIAAAEGASQRPGGLVIELTRPPKFYMDSSGSGGFYECGDFTEDQQATQIMVHHLGGPSNVLSGQLAKLVSLDQYQNRHNLFDPTQFIVSAPVSPMRPASQPNHMVHPHRNHHQMNAFPQENTLGLMGPPAPRGHKRQRSRSVPAAIDMSMLRHPMPSFLIQHEQPSAQPLMQDPNIFMPIPQHHSHPPQPFAPSPLPPGLSIDIPASYGMGLHFNGPMSATTANSPSEFGTPAFYTSAPPGDGMPPAHHFGTPFHNGFLQVDAGSMLGTSNTPLSMTSHGDPVIADHSPPLTGVGRSQSADLFGTPGEHSQFSDEGMYLSENFHKQIQLPFRSPMTDEAFHSPMPHGSYDFQSPPGTSGSQQIHIPFGGQPSNAMYELPPPQTQDGSMIFQSPTVLQHAPQQHQDSGVSFSTPSHMPQEQSTTFDSPKDSGMLYQDAKVYSSPGQLHHLPDEQAMYQNSPLGNGTNGDEFLYVDPTNLGQHPQ
ncbi:hypothetical protein LTR97_006330 [Elasticomyces elasticus]|uniref:Homeobox domain-containing protein n=1 Tax=Elasticomyces elasticus TaxID=574655 RepID=A0AAN8A2J2_9PEZI|nr:hypothetical protein LTR97_006330 [Elasticomyces elasticus]KAK5731341.1 hypothetical protein LTR15_001280 [Elasticomyces elasticus]